ncbi:MAG: RNA polymerase factor sigma-54 [Deltaproteobacteria bacterium]|nr:RNA polymerase factor sigma-54 [Deltaproteobacteria bacterium]
MALEIKQHLKLAQQLVITPQLQQAIKLLQLSRMELLDLIREEIKENPILEETAGETSETTEQETQISEEFGTTGNPETTPKDNDFDWQSYLYQDAKIPWDPVSRMGEQEQDGEGFQPLEVRPDKKGNLQDHLLMQLALSQFDRETTECAELIIGNLDDNGYLTATMDELSVLAAMSAEEVEHVLQEVQKFDPPGVAARDLKECLMLQLTSVKPQYRNLVREIIAHHLNNLSEKKYSVIAKDLQVKREDIIKAVKIITTLDPKPGRTLSNEVPQYITPDLYVYKIDGEYIVMLNEDGMPRLHVNSFYRQILSEKNSITEDSREYIKNKLRSAVWLIKSIYHRQNTLKNVMNSIIKFQRGFFDNGIACLRPLVLRDVAEDIEMHESTISRVTNNKYVHTPHGIFPLKFFFNSSINSVKGENLASESVKDTIKKTIAEENPRCPYSDQAIVNILMKKNINIARRTVTKYREMMSILPSNKRKGLF